MTLRLCPQIRFSHPDAPLIEPLAGVPAGKFTRLEELKAKYPDRQKGRAIGYKASFRYFAEVFAGAYLD